MTVLKFEKIPLLCGELGEESSVPGIMRSSNVQNRTRFKLDEFDEIYEAYGQVPTAYPYRQQESYHRDLRETMVQAAILENDLMQAVFLPEYGGRLWKLYDKKNGRDVVYTNDCLRASNLAVRNAWFSGGVEWNCGIIGHTPFTMDRIFAASVTEGNTQILRMYAYERIRGVVYQMDFWLDEQMPALNCHMNIHNPGDQTVPMYWWTNIASPLYPGGRLLVPGSQAYSYGDGAVTKVQIPNPWPGVDVSHYETIPLSKDFFFILDPEAPRWISHVDRQGKGLLHLSTRRLQSRKLFVWGQTEGGRHWQEFLTREAGPYLEVQAGLGKTQYGCIPMAPHCTWQWSERFESADLSEEIQLAPFRQAAESISEEIRQRDPVSQVEAFGEKIRTLPGTVLFRGTGDGALADRLRKTQGLPPMRPYLDFMSDDDRQTPFAELLDTGVLQPPKEAMPRYDPWGEDWLQLLEASVRRQQGKNWYAYYCIGLLQWSQGRLDLAEKAVKKSLKLRETPCGLYAEAVFALQQGRKKTAVSAVLRAAQLSQDTSLQKSAVRLLVQCGAWGEILELNQQLPIAFQQDPRIRLCCAQAHYALGEYEQSFSILTAGEGLVPEDVREGEISLGKIWYDHRQAMELKDRELPHVFNFNATDKKYGK